jgi:hypothetical protein
MATRKSAIWILASPGGNGLRETNETPKPTINEMRTQTTSGHLDLSARGAWLIVSKSFFT